MDATVLIPTWNGRERVLRALDALAAQTRPAAVVVADNASTDGTAEAIAERHPDVRVERMERNLGFGRAIDRVALALPGDAEAALVLVNDDVECRPEFLERLLAPLADPWVGMAAGVLVRPGDGRIDSAGIELDRGLGSYDLLAGCPLEDLAGARDPVGPCGGAAAYRLSAFKAVGGFDPALFAYWEDVDLALRLRAAGWGCVLARKAVAVHHHAQTLGAVSPARRELDQFGRGYLLTKYRVSRRPAARLAVLARDLPTLAATALARREWTTLRARGRGLATGYRREPPLRDPGARFATVALGDIVRRVWGAALSRTPR